MAKQNNIVARLQAAVLARNTPLPGTPARAGAMRLHDILGGNRAGSVAPAVIAGARPFVIENVTISAGNNQSGVAGGTLANPLEVLVTNINGAPLANVDVRFSLSSDDGTLAPPLRVRTNAAGIAQLPAAQWTLGSRGQNAVTAVVGGRNLVFVTRTGVTMAGVPDKRQLAAANSRVGQDPTVTVLDANGSPVAGVAVTFAVQAPVSSAVVNQNVVTNAAGQATCGNWTIQGGAGTRHDLRASAGVLEVNFKATTI